MPSPIKCVALHWRQISPLWQARLLAARGIQTAEQAHKFLSRRFKTCTLLT